MKMTTSNVILRDRSATSLIDYVDFYTIVFDYEIVRIWYSRGWFRTMYYAELKPPAEPPKPKPKLTINIGPVSNRIIIKPKVKLQFKIGPVTTR